MDLSSADQSAPAPSDTQDSASVSVNEDSGVVEVNRSVEGSVVEDLDSYNLIEPPPLDWKSDSSSEVGSADDLDDPGFPPAVDDLNKASPHEAVLVSLDVDTTVASLDMNQEELTGSNTDLVQDPEVDVDEEHEVVEEQEGEIMADLEGSQEHQEEITVRDVENILTEEDISNRRSGDEDHTRIHTLLSQLQLMGEEPHPSCRKPPCFSQHQYSSLSDPQACSPSLLTDDSSETTGLLFSENHQRDLLGLLQCTDLSSPSHSTSLPHRGEVDAVVSVSYSQEDAQRFWGHYGNGRQQRHRDDSLTSLPDDEYPEPVWMKLGEEPPEEEAGAESEQVGYQSASSYCIYCYYYLYLLL